MTETDTELAGHLRALEIELHLAAVRADAARLEALLHPEFAEFGRSGTVYSRASLVAHLAAETTPATLVADEFALRRLSPSVALLNYRSAHRCPDGALTRHTLRTSIWVHGVAGWQMAFHQGTATDPVA